MDKGFRNMVKTAFVPIMIYYFVHQISAMVLLSLVSGLYPEQVQYSGSMLTMLAKMVVMMLGGVAVFAYYSKEKSRAFLPVLAAAAGIFCGLLIHPQSPNTFILCKYRFRKI